MIFCTCSVTRIGSVYWEFIRLGLTALRPSYI